MAAAPAFLFLLIVGLWRHADGASSSGFAPILGLPVLWLALHGTLRQVWASVVAVGVVPGDPDPPGRRARTTHPATGVGRS